jgi:hypothetical protein
MVRAGIFVVRIVPALAAVILFTVPYAGRSAAVETDDPPPEIVQRYLEATRTLRQVLRGVQMEVNIRARIPKLEKEGKLQALRQITRLGKIIYKPLGFSGDNSVKQEVIARYLSAEIEQRSDASTAITPENYKFRLKAVVTEDGHRTEIFQLTPRKKRAGLFKGELWLDAETGMPLRESGELVKSPSFFLKKVAFTYCNELRDGVAYPKEVEWKADTRLVGRAELNIEFSNFTREDDDADSDGPAGH